MSGSGCRQTLLDHGGCDKADAASPVLGGRVEHVVHGEAIGVRRGELVELRLEQNVLEGHVGVDERHFGEIEGVLESSSDDLLLWQTCNMSAVIRYSRRRGQTRLTSMGVMPVPPAIMPMLVARSGE